MKNNKYEIHLEKIKTFDYKNATEKELTELIDETDTVKTELTSMKTKLEFNIEQLEKEKQLKRDKLIQDIPELDNMQIGDIEQLLQKQIDDIINSIQ